MNASTNSSLPQMGLQRFSVLHPYNVEVIDTPRPRGFHWEVHLIFQVCKQLMIALGEIPA